MIASPGIQPNSMNPINAGTSDKSTVKNGGKNGNGTWISISIKLIVPSILINVNVLTLERFIIVFPLFRQPNDERCAFVQFTIYFNRTLMLFDNL